MFGVSGLAIGVISNLAPPQGERPPTEPEQPPSLPIDFTVSGSNPNLTREGYPVTLSKYSNQVQSLFNPAFKGGGAGARSVWGLCVDEMRIAYYDTSNQWVETSFQINEFGWRWVVNDSENYLDSGWNHNNAGQRPRGMVENQAWQDYYAPTAFYPELDYLFFPDGPYANKGPATGGRLPNEYGTTRMRNWPEYHQTIAMEAWTNATPTNNSQVRGAVDNDDQIVFLAKNGRKVESNMWYQPA
jgi:hypothetical protein